MKPILAENMLRFGIKNLNESEIAKLQVLAEQEKSVSKKSKNVQTAYNLIVKGSAGWGTDTDAILRAFNYIKDISEFKTLLAMFKDKKTGYGSFEEMINEEYDRFNYNDAKQLQTKLRSIGVRMTFNTAENKFGNVFFDGNVQIQFKQLSRPANYKVNPKCISKYQAILPKAQQYWRDWLSSDITKRKFKTNHSFWFHPARGSVDDIFKKYLDCINKLKLVFYDNNIIRPTEEYEIDLYINKRSAMAFVRPEKSLKNIYVNCSIDDPDAYGSMIHEIQHLLYHIYPINPVKQIGNAFLKPGDTKSTIKDSFSTPNNNSIQLIKTSNSLNVHISVLEKWLGSVEYHVKQGRSNYICSQTEKSSNIQSIRHLLNIKPGQNITYQMIKPYVLGEKRHTDMSWILMCWASKGFKDINRLLSDMNKLAFNDTTPKDNNQTSGIA